MRINGNTKINALVVKLPNTDIVLCSSDMNYTVREYSNLCIRTAGIRNVQHFLCGLDWDYVKREGRFTMYKNDEYGSILLLN